MSVGEQKPHNQPQKDRSEKRVKINEITDKFIKKTSMT